MQRKCLPMRHCRVATFRCCARCSMLALQHVSDQAFCWSVDRILNCDLLVPNSDPAASSRTGAAQLAPSAMRRLTTTMDAGAVVVGTGKCFWQRTTAFRSSL